LSLFVRPNLLSLLSNILFLTLSPVTLFLPDLTIYLFLFHYLFHYLFHSIFQYPKPFFISSSLAFSYLISLSYSSSENVIFSFHFSYYMLFSLLSSRHFPFSCSGSLSIYCLYSYRYNFKFYRIFSIYLPCSCFQLSTFTYPSILLYPTYFLLTTFWSYFLFLFISFFSPDRNFVPFTFTPSNQVYSFFNINYCNSNFLFRYKTALAETRQTKDVRDKIAVYEDFYKFLSEKTGLNLEELLDLYNLLTAQVN